MPDRRWNEYEDFEVDYYRVLNELPRRSPNTQIAAALGISRFTLRRLLERRRRWTATCELCKTLLPVWMTSRKRFCTDACRAKYWRLK